MKRTVAVETDDIDRSAKIASLMGITLGRVSDHEIETSPSVSVTSEEVAQKIKAVTDLLSQQIAHLCEFMRELGNEQVNRRHKDTACSRADSSSWGSGSRSDNESHVTWANFQNLKNISPSGSLIQFLELKQANFWKFEKKRMGKVFELIQIVQLKKTGSFLRTKNVTWFCLELSRITDGYPWMPLNVYSGSCFNLCDMIWIALTYLLIATNLIFWK